MKKHLLLLLAILPLLSTAQTITTIAGNNTIGDCCYGGPATAASIYHPLGIVADAMNNIYFSVDNDTSACIRKIDPSGLYTRYAGTGTAGYSGDGGPAIAAELNTPCGLFIDNHGNMFIADAGNSVIRKINTSGIITTIAGNGSFGYSGDGGPATDAQLNSPNSVKVDTAGNMYIADILNNVIRKVSKTGIITTIAGQGSAGYTGDNGPATDATLERPADVALDSNGNIYISDYTNQVIRMIDKHDTIHTAIGLPSGGFAGDGGPATAARLYGPFGIVFDSSWNLLITDSYNNRVRRVDRAGIITTIAGNGDGVTAHTGAYYGDGGAATAAALYWPAFTAVGTAGAYYITDQSNQVIRKVDTTRPKNTLALKQPAPHVTLSIVPNPNTGSFCVQGFVPFTTTGQATMSIKNILGQVVYKRPLHANTNNINEQVALSSEITDGIYTLELTTGMIGTTTRFVISR